MSDLNKFGVIRLLHFDKGILSSHVAEFHYQKLQHFQKDMVFCIREKDWCIDIKSDDKESVLLFLHKNALLFCPWLLSILLYIISYWLHGICIHNCKIALSMGNYWTHLCNYYRCEIMIRTSKFHLLEIFFMESS